MHFLNQSRAEGTGTPFFYGWVILAAGTIGWVMTSPGQTPTVSVFVDQFIRDLSLSRSLVSGLFTIGTLLGSLALPFWGRQIDRRGTRAIVIIVAPLFGLACLFMATVHSAITLCLGFIAIRMLGQGALNLASRTAINRWWVRRRGMAMGLASMAMAIAGTGLMPRLAFAFIENFGWRTAYALLGGAVIFGMTPVGYFFFRRAPERYGLRPDGDPTPASTGSASRPQQLVAANAWTLEQAMRTGTFWLFVLSMSLFALVMTGQFFHLVLIFQDSGLPPAAAALAYAPIAAARAIASLSGGLLSDRLSVRLLLVSALLGLTIALLMASNLNGGTMAYTYGAILGLTGGLISILNSILWPKFYGRKHLGSINGFAMTAVITGSALGPLPFGIVRDVAGSYRPALLTAAAVAVAFALVNLLFAKRPKARLVVE